MARRRSGARALIATALLASAAPVGARTVLLNAAGVAQAEDAAARGPQQQEPKSDSCNWGPQSDGHHTARGDAIWRLALEEAGLSAESVSLFGCDIPKMPWSWVQRTQAMDPTKTHTYNFIGSNWWAVKLQRMGNPWPQFHARNWVLEFAKENFTNADVLKITDIDETYVKLGPWDQSSLDSYDTRHTVEKSGDASGGEKYHDYLEYFDDTYFQTMASSNFTLCPGGDRPWSMRFYEAIAAGSIPIVGSVEFDLSAPDMWALWRIPYKYYLKDSAEPYVFRQEWVDYNMQLLIKYQTFHEGDNMAPPRPDGL